MQSQVQIGAARSQGVRPRGTIPALDCRCSLGRGPASHNQTVKSPYAPLGPPLRGGDSDLSPLGGAPVEREWSLSRRSLDMPLSTANRPALGGRFTSILSALARGIDPVLR